VSVAVAGGAVRPQAEVAVGTKLVLLDHFQLWEGDDLVTVPVRCQRLLVFLALQAAPAARTAVAGMLWPTVTSDRAFGSLRATLCSLPRISTSLVLATDRVLLLSPHVEVDLHRVDALARRLVDETSECSKEDLDERLLDRDLLPGWSEEWIIIEQERFRQLRLHALEGLCRRLSQRGQYALAVQAGLAAVAGEPFRESAHHALICAHVAEGNRAEAMRSYRGYVRMVREELGLDPALEIEALVQGILMPPGA
jgi:DNA-binding SARP family transcriptional activator